MPVLKWLFQPAYLVLMIVLVALYVNREAVFSEEVTESLEAEALIGKVDELVGRLRSELEQPLPVAQPEAAAGGQLAPVNETALPVEPAADSRSPQDVTETAVDISPSQEALESAAGSHTQQATAPTIEQEIAVASGTEELPTPVQVSEPAEAVADVTPVEVAETTVPTLSSAGAEIAPPTVDTVPSPLASELVAQTVPAASLQDAVPVDSLSPVVTVDMPAQELPPLEVWRAARAAVWQGDLQGAVVNYRQLIALQPDNFDAYGEMGNVLLAQSNVTAAVEAYASAARLIHLAGHRQMAYRLASIVAGLDEEQGRVLYSELTP